MNQHLSIFSQQLINGAWLFENFIPLYPIKDGNYSIKIFEKINSFKKEF